MIRCQFLTLTVRAIVKIHLLFKRMSKTDDEVKIFPFVLNRKMKRKYEIMPKSCQNIVVYILWCQANELHPDFQRNGIMSVLRRCKKFTSFQKRNTNLAMSITVCLGSCFRFWLMAGPKEGFGRH